MAVPFISSGVPQRCAGIRSVYWLVDGFVLLSDVYMKLGRNLDAKQYLLSLKQNYQADDDIAGMIESRLEKLKTEN